MIEMPRLLPTLLFACEALVMIGAFAIGSMTDLCNSFVGSLVLNLVIWLVTSADAFTIAGGSAWRARRQMGSRYDRAMKTVMLLLLYNLLLIILFAVLSRYV